MDHLLAVLSLLLCLRVAAAPPSAVPTRGEPYWFKTYTASLYSEYWTGDLALKDFSRDLPKAFAAIEKAGGQPTQPLANFAASVKDKTQQLSFAIEDKAGQALLKSLRRLGDLPDPLARPVGAPVPVEEVKAKIAALMKERVERAAELARVPASAAAAEEILEHLLMVEDLSRRAQGRVLFNLQMRQK